MRLRLTSTQIDKLWEMNVVGGIWLTTDSLEYQRMTEFLVLGLVEQTDWPDGRRSGVCWRLTPKGQNVSLLHKSEEPVPAHSVEPDIKENSLTDQGVIIEGKKIEIRDQIMVKGRQGRYRFQDTHLTSTGRVVVNLIGPVGIHEQFCACYLEDAKLIPPVKVKRKRKVKT